MKKGRLVEQALRHHLQALQEQVGREAGRTPYDVYQELDLGPGGYAVAPSTQTRRGIRQALQKKFDR